MAAEHDGAAATAGGRRKKTARSEVLGVYRLHHGKYRARIWDPSRRAMKHLGAFATAEEAARAYDAAAVGLHGTATALTYFRQRTAATAADDEDDAPLRHVAATALTYFRQHTVATAADDGDAPLRHVPCVDMDAKADGGDAPLLHVSCVDEDAAAVESCQGHDAAESAKERKAPFRPVALTVFRRVRRRPSGKCVAKIRCPKGGARRYLGGFC